MGLTSQACTAGTPGKPKTVGTTQKQNSEEIKLQETTHKRNTCGTTTKGHKVPVLYQVDDFSVACTVESMRKAVIEEMGNT